MEDLKKKIDAMTPHNAFLVHAGVAALFLILFLFVGMFTGKVGGVSTGGDSATGLNIMFGKTETVKTLFGSATTKISFGFGGVLFIIATIALIGSVVYTYMKKVIDWRISAAAVALYFIGVLTIKPSVDGNSAEGLKVVGGALFWILLIVLAAWAAFGYFRGKKAVELNKK